MPKIIQDACDWREGGRYTLWGFGVLERSVVLDAASASFLCSCILGCSETPRRRASGGMRLSSSLDLLLGKLRNLGLEFVAWDRISWRATVLGNSICER